MTKGLTTNYLLTKTYKLKAGETILFHAAAGGVGQIFAQWANSIGAKVIGTVGSDEKIKVAEENGYSHVINYSKDDFAKEVLGDSMLLQFFSYKKDEWDRYHQAVTDWEVQEFLRLY